MTAASRPASEVERWLDAFEDRWIGDGDPPDIVAECHRLAPMTGFDDQRVAWELAMTDIEFRWRHWQHDLRRGTGWYSENLAPFGLRQAELEELGVQELIVRSRWGDSPAVEDLVAEQFPHHPTALRQVYQQRWRQHLEQKFPVLCTVTAGLTQRCETHLYTPCVVGRQRSADPPAPGLYHDAASNRSRLVVAERAENSVSREQLLLERVSVDVLRVTPLSTAVTVFAGDRRLQPDTAVALGLQRHGLELRFGPLILRFRRSS